MEVEVVRSTRRRRTVQARLVDGVLEVRVPARLSETDEAAYVRQMVERFEHRRRADQGDLERRATRLARRHDLPRPDSITWSDRQRSRWGSCTPETGAVRIASVLATYPGWVLDYVIVHELAHLVEPSHNADFHAIVARYPKAERAEGFLIAKGLGDDAPPPEIDLVDDASADPHPDQGRLF